MSLRWWTVGVRNNPSMRHMRKHDHYIPTRHKSSWLRGLGTAGSVNLCRGKALGLWGWAKQIVPVFMDSASEAVDYGIESIARLYLLSTASCPICRSLSNMDVST